jgi:uncharacterized protein
MKRVVFSSDTRTYQRHFRILYFWLAVACGTNLLSAGEPITVGETIRIASKILGEERTLLISPPENYQRSSERYPVLYMTDGDAHLLHTRGTLDFLARNGLMPECILVGITNTDRTRDLSPTHWSRIQEDGTRVDMPTSGGAGKFLDFFAQELFPYIESHYRTSPYRIFAGHSLGGLLALHIFAVRNELFQAYMAVSPSLNWDDDYPLRAVGSFLKDRKECNRILFVSMANEEDGMTKPTRFERLQEILGGSGAKGFIWSGKLMADEDHGSVVLRSHYWGLRFIFDGWRLPSTPGSRQFEGTLIELKEHFAKVGKRMGYDILPPEQTVNQYGYQLLARKKSEEAITVFQYNVELYPESANVYDSLGEALEGLGKLKEALDNYSKAVENAAKIGDKRLPVYTRNRDRAAAAKKP